MDAIAAIIAEAEPTFICLQVASTPPQIPVPDEWLLMDWKSCVQ